MDLLLASAGITNASIRAALVGLLGKPITDSTAPCIPTASYGMRDRGERREIEDARSRDGRALNPEAVWLAHTHEPWRPAVAADQ